VVGALDPSPARGLEPRDDFVSNVHPYTGRVPRAGRAITRRRGPMIEIANDKGDPRDRSRHF
jgi:hypothetical protein